MQLADWVIDTLDDKGRMSLRPIVISERGGRESNIIGDMMSVNTGCDLRTTTNANSANPKPIPRISNLQGLKFIRKSELQPEMLESKSVISIKGDKEFEYRFAKNPQLTRENQTSPYLREDNKLGFKTSEDQGTGREQNNQTAP